MEKCAEHSLELPEFAVRFFILISCFPFYIEKFLLQQVPFCFLLFFLAMNSIDRHGMNDNQINYCNSTNEII